MAKEITTFEAECDSCHGTGVYKGYCEGHKDNGMGTQCTVCRGSGKKVYSFYKFTGRNVRTDIQTVRMPDGTHKDYNDFLKT